MKLRDSGMPDEAFWETLFDVDLILDRLEIDKRLGDVLEMGCGYGTFTLPVARRISGLLRTYDIDPSMVSRTRQRRAEADIRNVACFERDVFMDGFGVPDGSQDGVLLFNILHCEEPTQLLTTAARAVRLQGGIYVIHWRYDPATPRGPSLEIRPKPEQIVDWAHETGLLQHDGRIFDLPPWHYGLRLVRVG